MLLSTRAITLLLRGGLPFFMANFVCRSAATPFGQRPARQAT